jgi:hypothetical protein
MNQGPCQISLKDVAQLVRKMLVIRRAVYSPSALACGAGLASWSGPVVRLSLGRRLPSRASRGPDHHGTEAPGSQADLFGRHAQVR